MKGLLLDSSVILAAFDSDDTNHKASHELLFGGPHDLASIDLLRYELANVTAISWSEPKSTRTVLAVAEALSGSAGLIASDMAMLGEAAQLAAEHSISVYDAAYVVAARAAGRDLVSCDERDLVSNGLALLPSDALTN